MSVMVRKLYKNGAFLYKMNLVAGKKGIDRIVKWVHIIEDDNATTFLHGNELVFTAGILNSDPEWLLNFAQKLYGANTSALVVNIGPHIKEIPQAVIQYCNEVDMPLFTIPWETRMVDMTRDFCHRIMNNEHVENNTATNIKNIIFNIGDIDTQVQQLERYGYQRDSQFAFISIVTDDSNVSALEEHKDALGKIAEVVAKSMHDMYITFSYMESLIVVLVNYTEAEISAFIENFMKRASAKARGWEFHMGVSENHVGIYNLKANFERALYAMRMARKRKEQCCFYDSLGIFKLLYAVDDKAVLRDFYKGAVGKLEAYDRENNTQLTDMLKTYLENNGTVQLVSEKQYVHRNTVTNQLKKIEEITGYNPLNLEDKVKLYMAFYIKEIL